MNVGARVRANGMTVGVAAGLLVTLALAVVPDVGGGSVATSYVPVQTTTTVAPAAPTTTPPTVYAAKDGSTRTCTKTDAGAVKCDDPAGASCAVTASGLECRNDMENAGVIALEGKCVDRANVAGPGGWCYKPCPATFTRDGTTCRWSGAAAVKP